MVCSAISGPKKLYGTCYSRQGLPYWTGAIYSPSSLRLSDSPLVDHIDRVSVRGCAVQVNGAKAFMRKVTTSIVPNVPKVTRRRVKFRRRNPGVSIETSMCQSRRSQRKCMHTARINERTLSSDTTAIQKHVLYYAVYCIEH